MGPLDFLAHEAKCQTCILLHCTEASRALYVVKSVGQPLALSGPYHAVQPAGLVLRSRRGK